MIYPYNDPQLLTDAVYVAYGGQTGSSTAFQRQVAYVIAESDVSDYINTPVVPTIITGTYFYPHVLGTVQLDWAWLRRVISIKFIDTKGNAYHTIVGTDNYEAAIRNADRSVVDIFWVWGNCYNCGGLSVPYQFQIVYEAGLPTGTSTSPKMLLALTKAAEQEINEIVGYGNESAGLVGITEFSNQQYREKRKPMTNSVFGSTPTAQYIQKLLKSFVRLMKVGL